MTTSTTTTPTTMMMMMMVAMMNTLISSHVTATIHGFARFPFITGVFANKQRLKTI
jgi:hypothetical protein